jgi:hypothetical protein
MIAALLVAGGALAQTGAVATKEYDSGAVYTGEFRDGKQHGQGTYTTPDGYEYTGEWVDGVIQGEGVAKFPVRVKCALLGWMALRDALSTHREGGEAHSVTYE